MDETTFHIEPTQEDCTIIKQDSKDITFSTSGKEVLSLKENGDIFVHGRLAENDKEVVDGMRQLLKQVFQII